MASVASGGTTERMVARTFLSVLRAGSGTRARYSSTLFGAPPFAGEPRRPDFAFFMRKTSYHEHRADLSESALPIRGAPIARACGVAS